MVSSDSRESQYKAKRRVKYTNIFYKIVVERI